MFLKNLFGFGNKNFKRNFFFVATFSLLILFAGCSGSDFDCSERDTQYIKYGYDPETRTCVVIQTIRMNECGNGVIEEGENHCNCPRDVPASHPLLGCEGTIGDFVEKACKQNKCAVLQNSKVVDQTRNVEFRNSDLTFNSEFTLGVPFVLNTEDNNRVEIKLNLFRTASGNTRISNIRVGELVLENTGGIRYGSVNYNQRVDSVGTSLPSVSMELSDTTRYSVRENLRARLTVSYTRDILNNAGEVTRSEDKIETITSSIGTWEIINPRFHADWKN